MVGDTRRNDSLVLPCCSVIVNIELRLKDIIEKANVVEEADDSYEKVHDLKKLWSIVKSRAMDGMDHHEGERSRRLKLALWSSMKQIEGVRDFDTQRSYLSTTWTL